MQSEDLVDIVNDDDEVVGRAPRRECHGNPTLIHRAVHVLVFRSNGDLVLQKRAITKDIQPGKWDTSVGGHLDPGEGYPDAARREMEEELGIAGQPLTFLYRSRLRNDIESENVCTYLTVYDGQIFGNPREISEIRCWSRSEIESSLGRGVFTPNFEDEWMMYLAHCRRYLTAESSGPMFCSGDSFPNLVGTILDEAT